MPWDEPHHPKKTQPENPETVGLPFRAILYTLDQVATMLNIRQQELELKYIHFDGRSIGARHPSLIMARNVAPPGVKPEWRINEQEIVRWCRSKRFKIVYRGFAR